MLPYNIQNWYWIVGGSTTQVYSSASAGYVTLPNSTYTAWLAAGGVPTKIDTETNLAGVFNASYPQGWYQNTNVLAAQNALAAGLTITSTSTSSLNGTYLCDPTTTSQINAEVSAILLNGTFADGTTSIAWPDASGNFHTMTIAQFKNVATAIGSYVSALIKVIKGNPGATLPSANVTIS